jgi:hypothetical protein
MDFGVFVACAIDKEGVLLRVKCDMAADSRTHGISFEFMHPHQINVNIDLLDVEKSLAAFTN